MSDIHSIPVRRGSRAGDLDDRGYGVGAATGNAATERCRAVRQVASMSRDADDCAALLDQLGLSPVEGVSSAASATGTGTTAATRRPREVM